ncbi:MAG: S8 family serine peptidase [Candidatus Lokiarchaeota archaeon]|nr:S8 family serine peptidase [Candidatus Lokiarchaeota archaeon]
MRRIKKHVICIVLSILFIYSLTPIRFSTLQLDDAENINNTEDFSIIPDVQLNKISTQMRMNPYGWYSLNLTGNSNASVAILGTGIDAKHLKFGENSYADLDYERKIIGWQDLTEDNEPEPVDPNGQDTFIAGAAFGINSSNHQLPLDSQGRVSCTVGGEYYHPEIFEEWMTSDYFEINLGSFNIDTVNSNITVNGTFEELDGTSYIQDQNQARLVLKYQGTSVNQSKNIIPSEYQSFDYNITSNTGIYDVIFKYYLGFSSPANFTIHSTLNFTIESISGNVANLTGIAPDTKIVGLRTLNEVGQGSISDLIDALTWINNNHESYQIVAATISLGEYQGSGALNTIINSLIANGVMVIIAAGDNGVGSSALNEIAENTKAIVVGAVNQLNQLTYYSSEGGLIDGLELKPDIVAPGGSKLEGLRSILGIDSNENDIMGHYSDSLANDTTTMSSTSISAGFVAAAYNILIECYGGYDEFSAVIDKEDFALDLKSYLLMTATETNMVREENPNTNIVESTSTFSPQLNKGSKDKHEGYGILNIDAAVEALNESMDIGILEEEEIVSSIGNASGKHAFARKIILEQNKTYLFNLTHNSDADIDLYLFKNHSNSIGEPILLKSSVNSGNLNESFMFGTTNSTDEYILVVKAVDGNEANSRLLVSELQNIWKPQLSDIYVNGTQGYNDTLDIFEFKVNYTDQDNIPPLAIYAKLDDPRLTENLTLVKENDEDVDYTDGCIYVGQHKFYEPGLYEYHFGVFDGNNFTRLPSNTNNTISVNSIENEEFASYHTNFTIVDNWDLDVGWDNYTQNSTTDDRGPDYDSKWSMLYFGKDTSVESGAYNYSSLSEAGVYTALSPQIWVGDNTDPSLHLGFRVSINIGDLFYIDLNTNRSDNWVNLETFTDYEADWTYRRYDLAQYTGNYIQVRFRAVINDSPDPQKSKGFMISDFRLINEPEPNIYVPKLMNISVSPELGSKYGTYEYSVYFGDDDEFPAQTAYLELDGQNRTMYNLYGDWNASYMSIDGENITSGGILYSYNVCLAEISNASFRIHIKSGGIWYSSENMTGPTLNESITGVYPFIDNGNFMSVYGSPSPSIQTIWFDSGNSFHFIEQDETWYSGAYYYQGYGLNWNVNLVTPVIRVPSVEEVEYSIVLTFDHKLLFDPTLDFLHNEAATIYISEDYGENWDILYQVVSLNDIPDFEHKKINLNDYRNHNVIIRFNFNSDEYVLGSSYESGWYIKDIEVNYDTTEDRTPPIILFDELTEQMTISRDYVLNLTLTDSGSGIDDTRVSVYIGLEKLEDVTSVNGKVSVTIDTRDFSNGEHTISVFAYDNDGNSAKATVTFVIDNPIRHSKWFIWLIIGLAVGIISLIAIYFIIKKQQEKREISERLYEMHKFDELDIHKAEEQKLTRTQRKAYEESRRQLYELRMRQRAERATEESENAKPYSLHCKNCNKWFKSWDYEWICPNCGNDSLYIALQCPLCNKWYYKDREGTYYCNKRKCKIRLLK